MPCGRRLTRTLGLVAAAWSVAACDPEELDDRCPAMPEMSAPEDYEDLELSCAEVPELCDLPVVSLVREPDADTAIDIVFVGDGYTEASMGSYRERVRELIDELSADADGIVGRDADLFNFHRIDLVTPGPDIEDRPLASCVGGSPTGGDWLGGSYARAMRAARNAPDVDLVVLIAAGLSTGRGGASGGSPFVIVMRHENSYRMLTHEMGHALVGLQDEYEEFDERHYLADQYEIWTGNPLLPNLSLSPDEDWEGIVDGAVEGGGRYATGVYRPTENCRMRDSEDADAFCPVCSAAIDDVLAGRRGAVDGPPRCGVALGHADESGSRSAAFYARDGNGLRSMAWSIDGAAPLVVDIATLDAHAARLPAWFEISSSADVAREIVLTCVDASGETTESSLAP